MHSDYQIRDILALLKTLLLKYHPAVPDFPQGWNDPEVKKGKQRLQIERQMSISPYISKKYQLPINILLNTGMRPAEIRALQVNDMVDNGLMVWKSLTDRLKLKRKNGGEVFYPLPDYLLVDLQKHIEGKTPDDFIFSIQGKPLGEGRLRKEWNKAIERAGVKHIELYQACRHSWASREMRQAKLDAIERIQKQLGHAGKQTQKNYIIEV